MIKQTAKTLCDIEQYPNLTPNVIPQGALVEVIRKVYHADFYSGIGYIIFWEEKAYASVVDKSRLDFVY